MELYDFNGKLLKQYEIAANPAANASTKVFEAPTNKLTDYSEGTYGLLTLKSEGKVIARKIHFFTQPKNLALQKPDIQKKIVKESGQWIISLKTDKLAKDVYLNFEGDEGFFEDNYFDLLPGETKTVVYKLKNLKTPEKDLSVISLWDSYQE